ncbi:MAG: hypothetical protein KME60_25140 [Cyanomargarita calcarea GSE-NOS-MK-12-04C]|jgi:hypothetical protein|uniref:Uncharacterized protein n=1 Tax=Cyanomargarita calcarea GSE-NOS-MK-12-04C TaxID=2839659 RepID=A0A951QT45_9CYAN|nr:hypothetical protein [Cyanomargarita calcarea GSE-NOS-MK-12-04C]
MYYFPEQPPYFLIAVGFFMALTSGAALSGTLTVIAKKLKSQEPGNSGARVFIKQLVVPFIGITTGVVLFVVSGLEIFGFPPILAYGIGLPISLLTSLLMWLQLGSMLAFVEREGGMKSLDLDSMS